MFSEKMTFMIAYMCLQYNMKVTNESVKPPFLNLFQTHTKSVPRAAVFLGAGRSTASTRHIWLFS